MVAPTYSWSNITSGMVDADSPINETLMTYIMQNLVHLEEWLGDGYTAAKDHDHDGTNSATAVLGDASVAQTKLKTTTGSGSQSVNNGNMGSVNTSQYVLGAQLYNVNYWTTQFRCATNDSSYSERVAWINESGFTTTSYVYYTYLSNSILKSVIYYDERTGMILGTWFGDADEPMVDLYGEPKEYVCFVDEDPRKPFIQRIILPAEHQFNLKRDVETEKAKERKQTLPQMVHEDYFVDIHSKMLIKNEKAKK